MPILFLDYVGTLTTIVAGPEMALLSPEVHRLLGDLAGEYPTSGRRREDVARRSGLRI